MFGVERAAAAVLTLAAVAGAQGGVRTLTPSEMQGDLFRLTEELELYHAGLRRYLSDEELDEAFGRALRASETEQSAVAFYRVVSELLASIHCGHTRASMAQRDRRDALEHKGVLPLELHFVGERAWVRAVLDDELPIEPGAEVLSIDGIATPEIRRIGFARIPGDGFCETGRARSLENRFGVDFVLLIDDVASFPEHYRIELAGAGDPVETFGMTLADYQERRTRGPERSPVELSIDEDGDYGYLFVQQFGDSPEGKLPDLLEESFRELRAKQVGHLILDLRGNGGGRDMYGAGLVSYLAREPFGYFERIEVTPGFEGPARIEERDGRRLMMSHDGLKTQRPAAQRFRGDVYLLIDGRTFSTAADVATVAHHNGLATLIGEETGGGYDGNTSGQTETIGLPASGFAVNVPRFMYTTANLGHSHFGRGAPPDHPVRASVEDVLAGRDPELEKALELIRSGR